MNQAKQLALEVAEFGAEARSVDVLISYDVVKLLSEQLYASPVKAIEELVVNGWDAGAEQCSVLVDLNADRPVMAVLDTGYGMTLEELENLWHIGVSQKSEPVDGRKQIGKFGIGKLASYAVARRATYVSKSADGIHAVAINFEDFAGATDADGIPSPVQLIIRELTGEGDLLEAETFKDVEDVLTVGDNKIDLHTETSWTLVVLEDLKEKASSLQTGRLRWVLETAMPLAADFALFLNTEAVSSSKSKYNKVVSFQVTELEDDRLKALGAVTGQQWQRQGDRLVSPSFPSGVSGEAFVTHKSLYADGGKSEDLGRSHGFFVRVNNRLINETDPLFGARPLSFTTWYRFAAIVEADDLNPFVTASRDDVEQTELKGYLRQLLLHVFNQARERYEAELTKAETENKRKPEGTRDYVSTTLVEGPLADALVQRQGETDPEPWEYLQPVEAGEEVERFVESLYAETRETRSYTYRYVARGREEALVRFDGVDGVFEVNEDHDLVLEFGDRPDTRQLLEVVIASEALLEVYLRQADMPPETVRDIVRRRDRLLRSLARDQSYSLTAIAQSLQDAVSDAYDLEVALVGALRALGFAARHIGGSGTPDGLAHYKIFGLGDQSFTLEAKSSKDVPSLSQLDFAGLRSHYEGSDAQGCLLVAPSYPGGTDAEGEVSVRAQQQRVSCWTVEQLAGVVAAAESRHINARTIQEIVLTKFRPLDVTKSVDALLQQPKFTTTDLYNAVLSALGSLQGRLAGTPRSVMLIAGEISRDSEFEGVDMPEVAAAIRDLSKSSKGMLWVTESEEVHVLGDLEELARRVQGLTRSEAPPRRRGTFKKPAE